MKGKEKTTSPPGSAWTSPDDYIGAMARKRSYRRAREPRSGRLTSATGLSTIPLAAILAVLAVLVVSIMIVAFPGSQPSPPEVKPHPVHEQGVAPRGWFQEAQKQFHR